MSKTNFDSLEIGTSTDTGYCEEKVLKKTITSAQLLALNAAPVELVPAPGAGNVVEFLGAIFHKPAGTAYAGIAAGEDLAVKYTNSSGTQVNTSLETTGFLDQTTAQTRITRPIVTEYTPVSNAALVVHLLSGEITTGDSPLYIVCRYRIYNNTTTPAVI